MNKKKKTGKKNGSSSSSSSANSHGSSSGSPMDVSLLERMVRLMSTHDLSTIDVRDGDQRVILKRGAEHLVAPNASSGGYPSIAHVASPAHAPSPGFASGATSGGAAAKPSASDEDAGLLQIKSPMVGTFYASPSPDAKPFVSVGTRVDEESDVCIIEAMKVFNNIKAECSGTIARIMVNNGETVEFGQVLFLVKP